MSNPNINSLQQIVEENERGNVFPEDQFSFTPIESMFDSPATERAEMMMVDPAAVTGVREVADIISDYGFYPTTNINNPLPGPAGNVYNPDTANSLNKPGSFNSINAIAKGGGEDPLRQNTSPIAFSLKESNFARYYNHPEFSNLGFTPYANMEDYYNANSTIWDDFSRAAGQYFNLFGASFRGYGRTLADLVTGDFDSLFSGDEQMAEDFEQAMMIGNSSRGGFGGFVNNLGLNSAYTMSIITQIAAEELAMLAGTAALGLSAPATGGATLPAAGTAAAATTARSGYNLFRIGNSFRKLFSFSNDFVKSFKSFKTAENFWQASRGMGRLAANAFTPNTLHAVRRLRSTKGTAQGMRNIAVASDFAGSFYRDARLVNLALAESRLEAGLTYNEVRDAEVARQEAMGNTVDPDMMRKISNMAGEAGFESLMANMPIIYASNWLVLGTALGGFRRTLGQTVRDGYQQVGRRMLRNKRAINPKTGRPSKGNVISDAGGGLKNYLRSVRAAGVRGSGKLLAGSSLRFFANNIAEGVQEVSQEAINVATSGYYGALFRDPLAGGYDLRAASIKSGMGSQLSGQGFETFMSGFLMGGIVQGPQRLLFQGIPNLYKFGGRSLRLGENFASTSQNKAFKEFQENKQKTVDAVIEAVNFAWDNQANDFTSMFDPKKFDLLFQKQAQQILSGGQEDIYNIRNVEQESLFFHLNTIFESGTQDLFIEQLNDFKNLSDKALLESGIGNFTAAEIKSGKARAKIDKQINNVKRLTRDYNTNKDKFPNPYNPKAFDEGSTEYIREQQKVAAWNHMRMLVLFTKDAMVNAADRSKSIYSKLQNEPLFENMGANDVVALTSKEGMVTEMRNLQQELKNLANIEQTEEIKEDIKQKTEKLKLLSKFFAISSDPKNTTAKGTFDKRKINALESAFEKYIQFMANSKGSFIEPSKVRQALIDIVDHQILKDDVGTYNRALLYLNDPKVLDEIFDRTLGVVESTYADKESIVREQVNKYIDLQIANQLINDFFKIDIVPDPDQNKIFLQTGDASVLKTFYSSRGTITMASNRDKFLQIQNLISSYNKMVAKEEVDKTADETVEVAEVTNERQQEILDEAGIDIELQSPNNTPMLNALLNNKYKEYSALATAKGDKNILSYNAWRNSEEAQLIQSTFNAIKKVWAQGYQTFDAKGEAYTVSVSTADVNSENGFTEFLNLRVSRENPVILDLLSEANLKLSDITNEVTSIPQSEEQEDIYKVGTNGVVKTIPFTDEGGGGVFYQLEDGDGNLISEEKLALLPTQLAGTMPGVYTTPSDAVDALTFLDSQLPDDSTFNFDGIPVHFGETVIGISGKNKGIEFLVKSTPNQANSKNTLRLIRKEDNDKNPAEVKFEYVGIGQFAPQYKPQSRNVELLNNSFAKVDYGQPTMLYPYTYQNERMIGPEGYKNSEARMAFILSNLTADELQNLQVVIKRDPEGGKKIGQYKSYYAPNKQSNPQLIQYSSKFQIGFALPSPAVMSRINDLLAQNNMSPILMDDNGLATDGVFAFVPNSTFQIQLGNEVIDPRNVNEVQALNIMDTARRPAGMNDKEFTEAVRNQFALNALLSTQAEAILAGNPTATFAIQNEQLFSFNLRTLLTGAVQNFDNIPKPSSELQYNKVDGQSIIIDVKRDSKGNFKSENFIVDNELTKKQRTELVDKVKNNLGKQGLYDKIVNGSDRYYLIFEAPNGTFGYATLAAEQLTEKEYAELANRLIDRAQLTQKENLNDQAKLKDEKAGAIYNLTFNNEIKNDLFIKLNKTGYTVSLQVTAYGELQMSLYDKDAKQEVISVRLSRDKVNNTEEGETPIKKLSTLITQFNQNNKVGVKVTATQFSKGFADNADINTILGRTSTGLARVVFKRQRVIITGDSAGIAASKEVPQASTTSGVFQITEPYSDKPTGPVLQTATQETSAEAEYSVLDMSDQEFNDMMSSGKIPAGIINQVAETKIRGQAFSPRETIVYNEFGELIDMKVATSPVKEGGLESVDTVSDINSKIEQLKVKLLEGVAPRDHFKTLKQSQEYQKLLAQKRREDKGLANKILGRNIVLGDEDIVDINQYMTWARANLPDFITIEDISVLGNNLQKGGVRVGAFAYNLNLLAGGLDIKGTIYTGANSPFKYHEAFHGVYRMLLTSEEQANLQSIARKEVRAKLRAEGKSFEKELQRFKNSADTYSNMSRKELEAEYYEEYMADEFEKFKKNPKSTSTNTEVKSFFTRLLEWIKATIERFTKSDLQKLFENIDAGKFKNADVANNPQQAEASFSNGPVIANAIIPYESTAQGEAKGFLYLDSNIADMLVRGIAANYLARANKMVVPFNKKEIFDSVVSDYQWLYSPNNPLNENKSEQQKQNLVNVEKAFFGFELDITEQANQLIELIDGKGVEIENTVETEEDNVGVRTTTQYDLDASMIGGFKAIPADIRRYIALTSIAQQDYFGNEYLVEGERIIVPVDYGFVFNAMLKAVSTKTDTLDVLKSLYLFGLDNPQAGAVVTRLLQDVGYSADALLNDESLPQDLPGASLLNSFTKAFQNVRVNYLFTEKDQQGNIRIYTAAQNDDINSQSTRWQQAFYSKRKVLVANKNVKDKAVDLIDGLNQQIKRKTNYTDKELERVSRENSIELFDLVGIKLSPGFIKHSILAGKNPSTLKQREFKKLFGYNTTIQQTAGESQFDTLTQLSELIQSNVDIFNKDSGMLGRLEKLSIANAPFDETIGASVFRDSNSNLRYAHQKPTYNLLTIDSLNSETSIEELKEDPYRTDNFLLNSPFVLQMSNDNMFEVQRMEGVKSAKQLIDREKEESNVNGPSSRYNPSKFIDRNTYGDFTAADFALNLINTYTSYYNPKSGRVNSITIEVDGNEQKAAMAPIQPFVMEASNTGDTVGLPVIKTVDNNNELTDEAVDIFLGFIKNEFSRINREALDLTLLGDEIQGYNTQDGRAFQFFNTKMLLSPVISDQFATVAVQQAEAGNVITFDEALKFVTPTLAEVKSDIKNQVEAEYAKFNDILTELQILEPGLISNRISKGLTIDKGVSRTAITESEVLLNLNNNLDHNLRQIFFNHYLNAVSLDEVLHGDKAQLFKSAADRTKRAKGNNNSGPSAQRETIDKAKGIFHPVDDISFILFEEVQEDGIDVMDAINYGTVKTLRYLFGGFGYLSDQQADLLNHQEVGTSEALLSEKYFGSETNPLGYAQTSSMSNSKKIAYFDGQEYKKTTLFILTPEYTSNFNEDINDWVAKPGMEKLHNLRVRMENLQNSKDTIVLSGPVSSSKARKAKVQSAELVLDTPPAPGEITPHTTLSAKHMRLQQITPSNKQEVIDPTQNKELATGEQDNEVRVKELDMSVGEIISEYNKAISNRHIQKFKDKRNLVFNFKEAMDELNISKRTGTITPRLTAFLKYAVNSLKAGQTSTNLIEFFSTENGNQNYNLNNPIVVKRYEQLFLSYFTAGVFSEKVPGYNLSLIPSHGSQIIRRVYEVEIDDNGNTVPVRSEVIRQKVWQKTGNNNEIVDLSTLTNNNIPPSGLVVLDRQRIVKVYSDPKDPNSYTGQRAYELVMPAHSSQVRDLIENTDRPMPKAISKVFSVRIPTQDNHSTAPGMWVDFMPAGYGSVVRAPNEIIKISGSDHDGDKLVTLIKEYYVDSNGNFREYGKTTNAREEYLEYVRYINKKVRAKGTIYSEVFELYNNNELAANIDNSPDSAEIDIATDPVEKGGAGMSIESSKALSILGLPITQQQYSEYKLKHGFPYQAPDNNKVVDYKYALMGNDGVTSSTDGTTPISYQPATEDSIIGALSNLGENSQYFKDRAEDIEYEANNMFGLITAFKDNKGASIGAAVLPNLYLSKATEYSIAITNPRFVPKFNNTSYDNYAGTKTYTGKGKNRKEGERKQDANSAIISMTVDNPTNRHVGKLGFNRHATSLAINLLALGVPMETIITFVNTPIVKDIYFESSKRAYSQRAVEKEIGKQFAMIFQEQGNKKFKRPQVTNRLMLDLINQKYDGTYNAKDNLDANLAILGQMYTINNLMGFTSKMSAVTGLTKGIGKNMIDINRRLTNINDLLSDDAPMNLYPIYTDTWQGSYIETFKQLSQDLLPLAFLRSSPAFSYMLDGAFKQADLTNPATSSIIEDQISLDLLSYLTIKGYMNNMLENESHTIATLSNEILYPSSGAETIVDIVDKLKETPQGQNNTFLESFVILTRSSSVDNTTGLNLAEANTFNVLNAFMKTDLQNDFARLYGSLDTRQSAIDIVNYIMVKDGLQLKYKSLLEAVSPYVLNKFLSHVDTVSDALRNGSDQKMNSVFGATIDELVNDFVSGYFKSSAANDLLLTLQSTPGIVVIDVSDSKVKVKVNWDIFYSDKDGKPEQRRTTSEGELLPYRGQRPKYIRLVTKNEGQVTTRTYGTEINYAGEESLQDQAEITYEPVQKVGSVIQNGIGFMFGDLLTSRQLRNYVSNKADFENNSVEDPADIVTEDFNPPNPSSDKFVAERAMNIPNANIEAVQGGPLEKSEVTLKVDIEAPAVNLADTAKLLEAMNNNEEAVENDDQQVNVIEETDTSLPEMNTVQADLFSGFVVSLDEKYPELFNFWEDNIQRNPERKALMRAQGAGTFAKWAQKFEDPKLNFESEQEYIEDTKQCILKM